MFWRKKKESEDEIRQRQLKASADHILFKSALNDLMLRANNLFDEYKDTLLYCAYQGSDYILGDDIYKFKGLELDYDNNKVLVKYLEPNDPLEKVCHYRTINFLTLQGLKDKLNNYLSTLSIDRIKMNKFEATLSKFNYTIKNGY